MTEAPNAYSVETRELEDLRRKYQVASALLADHSLNVERLTEERDNYRADYFRMRALMDRNHDQNSHCTITRAYEIADQSMLELIRSHTLPVDESGQLLIFAGENGHHVDTLAGADPAVHEAVEWLVGRGMAQLLHGTDCECLLLKEVE